MTAELARPNPPTKIEIVRPRGTALKGLAGAALCLVFGALSFSGRRPEPVMGVLAIAFGALLAVNAVLSLRDRRYSVTIDARGIGTTLWGVEPLPWSAIRSTSVETWPGPALLLRLQLRDPDAELHRLNAIHRWMWRRGWMRRSPFVVVVPARAGAAEIMALVDRCIAAHAPTQAGDAAARECPDGTPP